MDGAVSIPVFVSRQLAPFNVETSCMMDDSVNHRGGCLIVEHVIPPAERRI